ncbi:hypothetical protein Plhal703r1_c18g0082331 [Plasmopara halstedii]
MFVPILSSLLLLDVSVSSTSNSSIALHKDSVVFVRHLNDSLPPANSSLTVAEDELKSYDESEQDNIVTEIAGETRMFPFISKLIPCLLYPPSLSVKAIEEAEKLLEHKKLSSNEWKRLSKNVATLFESNDEVAESYLDTKIFDLLIHPATTETTQEQLLKSERPLSYLLTRFKPETEGVFFAEFFRLQLHIPFLSYAIKVCKLYLRSDVKDKVAEDVAWVLTTNRDDGNILTWLGMLECGRVIRHNIHLLVGELVGHRRTANLAYRLQAMRSNSIDDFFSCIPKRMVGKLNVLLDYAAYVRFNFIEHETKSFGVVLPNLFGFLKKYGSLNVEKQEELFSDELALTSTSVDSSRFYLFVDDIWREISEDQLRLFKAAVQSKGQAKLVREALEGIRKGASVAMNLGGMDMKASFKGMLKNEKFVQWLQEELKDEKSVQLLQTNLYGLENEVKPSLLLPKDDVEMMAEKADVVTIPQKNIPDIHTLHLLKMFLADNEGVDILRDVLGRLTLLDDMLSSTELDTVPILKAILADQNKVLILKEVMKDEVKLESFRMVLGDDQKMYAFWHNLRGNIMKSAFETIVEDMNQVFSLRVATKDDVRARLFRAALKDKLQVEKFVNALEKKKLTNIFRSILQDEEKMSWLKSAVADDYYMTFEEILQRRDRVKLAEEMLQHLTALKQKGNRNP